MARTTNTNGATSKKYWEAETPIVTETTFAEIRYYKEAGKIQLYPLYEDRNGEMQLGRGCVWDNNDIDADEATALAYGIMRALLDSGVENDAFADAYAILDEAFGNNDVTSKLGKQTAQTDDELDEEFEDEEDGNDVLNVLSDLELADIKAVAKELGVKVMRKDTEETLMDKITENCDGDDIVDVLTSLGYMDDSDEDEEGETTSTEFVGKKLICKDGEVSKANKKTKKVYIEWADDAIEWANYIAETSEELRAMPTKTPKQKKAQDKAYTELKDEVTEWEDAWGEEVYDDVYAVCKELIMGQISATEGICKFVAIIDGMEL